MKKRYKNATLLLTVILLMTIQTSQSPEYLTQAGQLMASQQQEAANVTGDSAKTGATPSAGVIDELSLNTVRADRIMKELSTVTAAYLADELSEEDIYSFLQGPRSWGSQIDWSGEWAQAMINGNSFGGFGCGLVTMANVYSTLSDYECSPLDMLSYAMEVSGYYPTRKAGAIGWDAMNTTLQKAGMMTQLHTIPSTYEEFRAQIAASEASILLISSANDDSFWQDVPGHYVSVYLYEEDTDTVFLTDSGDPDKNRTRVSLQTIYAALKTASEYQYLTVESYSEDQNQWKFNGITDTWVRPAS